MAALYTITPNQKEEALPPDTSSEFATSRSKDVENTNEWLTTKDGVPRCFHHGFNAGIFSHFPSQQQGVGYGRGGQFNGYGVAGIYRGGWKRWKQQRLPPLLMLEFRIATTVSQHGLTGENGKWLMKVLLGQMLD